MEKAIEKLVHYIDILEKENKELVANNAMLSSNVSNQSITIFELQVELKHYKEEYTALLENMERSDETN